MLAVQGPRGEWPWLIGVARGRPVEHYPLYAVHQDSMAMLFLLPALDGGLDEAHEAMARSFAWALGGNELGISMYANEPFAAYRSIYRSDPLVRASRYVRAVSHLALRRESRIADGTRLRVNRECRSYHLGWLLYVWSRRPELMSELVGRAPELTAAA